MHSMNRVMKIMAGTCALLSCLATVHGIVDMLVAGYGEFTTDGCIPDTVNGAKFVRDLYEKVHDTAGES